jgi:voltage-gated sodium channel
MSNARQQLGSLLTTKPSNTAAQLQRVVEASWFQRLVIGLIIASAILVGLETSTSFVERHGPLLGWLNRALIWLFVIEMALRLAACGGWREIIQFLRDPWNFFDLCVVLLCALPLGSSYVSILRLARVLRVLRIVTAIPRLQILVGALFKSIPSMVYVGLILLILFYIYAVLGTFFFSANDPMHFGDLMTSMLSLFRVVTLEDWTDLMYIQMYGCHQYGYSQMVSACVAPSAQPLLSPLYFVSFVVLGTMIVLNLFIGVVLNSMSEAQKEAERTDQASYGSGVAMVDRLASVTRQLEQLKQSIEALSDSMHKDSRPLPPAARD